jgi:hypothetical protein
MIVLFVVLLFYSLFTMFTSMDALELARGAMRVLLTLVLVVVYRFSDQVALEGVVLILGVIQLALLAFVRMEVRLDHERN